MNQLSKLLILLAGTGHAYQRGGGFGYFDVKTTQQENNLYAIECDNKLYISI